MELASMLWKDVEDYLTSRKTIVIPIGSTEQHGRFLPVSCDTLVSESIARAACRRTGTLMAPAISTGCSESHLDFPGTVSLAPCTLSALVEDVTDSLYRHGFRNILFFSGHGGNRGPVTSGLAAASTSAPEAYLRYLPYWELEGASEKQRELFDAGNGYHVTAAEYSICLHLITDLEPPAPPFRVYPREPAAGEIVGPSEWRRRYPDGASGLDTSVVSRESGHELYDFLVEAFAGLLSGMEA